MEAILVVSFLISSDVSNKRHEEGKVEATLVVSFLIRFDVSNERHEQT